MSQQNLYIAMNLWETSPGTYSKGCTEKYKSTWKCARSGLLFGKQYKIVEEKYVPQIFLQQIWNVPPFCDFDKCSSGSKIAGSHFFARLYYSSINRKSLTVPCNNAICWIRIESVQILQHHQLWCHHSSYSCIHVHW